MGGSIRARSSYERCEKVLTQQLREMERDEVVRRRLVPMYILESQCAIP